MSDPYRTTYTDTVYVSQDPYRSSYYPDVYNQVCPSGRGGTILSLTICFPITDFLPLLPYSPPPSKINSNSLVPALLPVNNITPLQEAPAPTSPIHTITPVLDPAEVRAAMRTNRIGAMMMGAPGPTAIVTAEAGRKKPSGWSWARARAVC
jgi:hypothetical protein